MSANCLLSPNLAPAGVCTKLPAELGQPPTLNPTLQFTGGYGPGDVEALAPLATQFNQMLAMLPGLDTLGDHIALEGERKANHAFEDG
nr:hypothetical protein [Hydrocarboniclastica marina]